jgi:hypothetical protein
MTEPKEQGSNEDRSGLKEFFKGASGQEESMGATSQARAGWEGAVSDEKG